MAGLPVIVGGNGDPTEARKVVTCASYQAREFGVRAGMPLRAAARRCPDATFLASDPAAYDAASEEVMALLRDLGHPVEVWGWDEAYIAVADGQEPVAVAEQIRAVIASETGLSCSVGISDNKQRAKVATGFAKPAGIFSLTDANWMTVMGDRPVDELWGVGPKTAQKLAGLGVTTVRQLAGTEAELLTATFGPRTGLWLLLLAKGGGDSSVSAEPWVPRSRSHVVTFPQDLTDRDEMAAAVVALAQRTLSDAIAQGRIVTRVAVTVRTATFFTRTKIRKLPEPTTDPVRSSPPRCASSTCSTWTGRSGCWGCGWNSRPSNPGTRRDTCEQLSAMAQRAAAPGRTPGWSGAWPRCKATTPGA